MLSDAQFNAAIARLLGWKPPEHPDTKASIAKKHPNSWCQSRPDEAWMAGDGNLVQMATWAFWSTDQLAEAAGKAAGGGTLLLTYDCGRNGALWAVEIDEGGMDEPTDSQEPTIRAALLSALRVWCTATETKP